MTLFRMTPTMLHSIDRHGNIEEVSDVWLAKLGYTWDEVIGRPSTDFLSEDSARYARDVVLPTFFEAGSCEVEYEMRRKDGGLVPVRLRGVAVRSETGAFVRSIAVLEDLTERRQLEHKMLAAQKLESLGFMAGNIAHDFNNLLASIVGNAQLGLRHAGELRGAASALNNIMVASARAADLCRQLLAYSGRGRFEIEIVDLDDIVREMAEVLQVNIGERARIELALGREGARVLVDATQMRQILMNLVINAGEAADGDATITITTAVRQLDAAAIAVTSHPDAMPGTYVALSVADDGCGMTPDVLEHIFDPFFTTKSTGRGLGLAAVHGIVRGHHGTMRVDSTPGCGTRFELYLPVATSTVEARTRTPTPGPRARGTVVIVDDDELLRTTLATQLAESGYETRFALSADEVLALARGGDIDGFLIDVTMPGMSGPELARRLQVEVPGARVVLMSGYNHVDIPALASTRFLRKPFTEDELLRALARAR